MTRPDTSVDELTTLGYLANGLPAWKVTGPRGAVTFLLGGNLLLLDPTWTHAAVIVDRRAGQLASLGVAGDDDQVLKMLAEHYHQLPAGPPDWPATPEQWCALDMLDLVAAFARCRWYAREDDKVGTGWAVMPVDLPPSCGIYAVGWFMNKEIAETVAREHNAFLPETTNGDQ